MIGKVFGSEQELCVFYKPGDGHVRVQSALLYTAEQDRSFGLGFPTERRHQVALANGGKMYPDRHLLEVATPECLSSDSLPVWERSCRAIVQLYANQLKHRSEIPSFFITSGNTGYSTRQVSGYSGNQAVLETTGYHLNVSIGSIWPDSYYQQMLPLLAVLQLISGSGVFLDEVLREDLQTKASSALSPRALSVWPTLDGGLNMNTFTNILIQQKINNLPDIKDLNDKDNRLQIATLDNNQSPFATKLKAGIVMLVMGALERGWEYPYEIGTGAAVARNFREISLSTGEYRYITSNQDLDAIDILRAYLEGVEKIFGRSRNKDINWTTRNWLATLHNLRFSPELAVGLDWVNKRNYLGTVQEKMAGRYSAAVQETVLRKLDLGYHSVDPTTSWYASQYGDWMEDQEVIRGMYQPPMGTRARGRGRIIQGLIEARKQGKIDPDSYCEFAWGQVGLPSLVGARPALLRDPLSSHLTEARRFLAQINNSGVLAG